jgi:superfamily II DNA/RNA helicase
MSASSPRGRGSSPSGSPSQRGTSQPRHRSTGSAGPAQPVRRRPNRKSSSSAKPIRKPEPSALERALDDAAMLPEPAPRDFAQLGLPAPLVTVLARRGVHQPFAIQSRTLPDALAGRDILGRAQTGSGKTLGFGLPLLTRLVAGSNKRTPGAPRGLVLVPTRELARQVADELSPLGHPLYLRVTTVYGGAPMGRQIEALRRGVDIVVATPGRLIDLLERRALTLDSIEVTVLDEADHMADLGFLPAVTQLLDQTPEGGQRMLFSATLDRGVGKLVERYLNDPAMHAVASAASPVEDVDHHVFTVRNEDKVALAAEITARPARTLLFVRTKHGADRLARQLGNSGVEAVAIHGNLNQGQRQRALDGFSAGRTRVMVATDVAARGIHVDDVDLVVHYDPPNDSKDYLHRSGRTARAGASGTVVSFVDPAQSRDVARMLEAASVTATTVSVRPGAPEVRLLAESGEPIVVTALPDRSNPPSASTQGHSRSRTQSRQGRQSGRPSGASSGASRSRNPRQGGGADRSAAHHKPTVR